MRLTPEDATKMSDMITKAENWVNCYNTKCGYECNMGLPCLYGYETPSKFDLQDYVQYSIPILKQLSVETAFENFDGLTDEERSDVSSASE